MSAINLPFGHISIIVNVPDKNLAGTIMPFEPEVTEDGVSLIKAALENPVNCERLGEIVAPGASVAVIVSDTTRPTPTAQILPLLFEELHRGGIRDENITIIFALGIHRNQTGEEMERIVGGDIYRHIRCIEHDNSRCRRVGETSRGTPIEVFKNVLDADVVVCVGNIEFHYYAGYSGGAKAILPGVSSRESIIANHKMMMDEKASSGRVDSPVRQDMEEAAQQVGVDFMLNVVLNSKKEIVYATAGHVIDAHRMGVVQVDKMYKVSAEPVDVVIVSPGGYPKDINIFQAHKALDNAKNVVVKGGTIILAAQCCEGFGNAVYEHWNNDSKTPDDAIMKFKHSFEFGGHKAALIAQLAKKYDLYLVSDLPDADAINAFFNPAGSVQEVLDRILNEKPDAKVCIMPYGGLTLPFSH
ncbi:MAG TPA: nickel-dependent lactate racemase [Methanosarcinaceae archaeon]|nr:nickel-dependent lactate racemase [Methanosarcinaceae archaeon]